MFVFLRRKSSCDRRDPNKDDGDIPYRQLGLRSTSCLAEFNDLNLAYKKQNQINQILTIISLVKPKKQRV